MHDVTSCLCAWSYVLGTGVCVPGPMSMSRRVSHHGVSLSKGGLCQGDPRTVKSGRYASHWSAFLL